MKNEDDPRKVTNIVAFAKIYNWASTLKNALIYNNILFPGENENKGNDTERLLDEAGGDMSLNLGIVIKGKR